MWTWIVAVVLVAAAYWYFTRSSTPSKPITLQPLVVKPTGDASATRSSSATLKKRAVSGPPMKILFGSQTGTAEDFALELSNEAIAHQFAAEVQDLESYFQDDPETLADEPGVVAFVVSTYGDGEPTDNAKDFMSWLLDDAREPGMLSKLKYIIFGLGNKTYEQYNATARKLDQRLLDLGAKRIFERGEGDEDSTLEADYEHWRKNLWQPLCNEFGIPCAAEACHIKPPLYKLRHHEADVKQASYVTWQKGAIDRMIIDVKNPRLCKVVERRELHAPGSDRSCLHVEIEIPETMIYEAGDHVGLFAPNNTQLVEQAAALLNVQLDSVISVIPVAGGRPVIGPCPIRRVLSHFVELTSVPRKTFMIGVLQYTTDPDERTRLEKLLADDDAYLHYTKTSHRSVLEVLTEFPSCKMPFEHFVELVAPMIPRYYSISSSPKEHPQRVHITAVLVQYQTPTGRLHDGVCTSWLSHLQPGTDMVPAFIRKSNFKLPRNPAIPIIMVGPGTGVAPFRGFIQDRKHWQRDKLGKSVLFFGCRNENVDFLYADELKSAVSEGYLTSIVTAFSRDQSQKIYVQHRIREHQELIWETMENNGYIFVCGDAKLMAKDVYETLRQIIMDLGGKTPEQAKQYLTSLQTANRYLQDIWQ